MARSTKIYTIWRDGHILAGFTVKHEAIAWAKRNGHTGTDCFLWSAPDGHAWGLNMTPLAWPLGT